MKFVINWLEIAGFFVLGNLLFDEIDDGDAVGITKWAIVIVIWLVTGAWRIAHQKPETDA